MSYPWRNLEENKQLLNDAARSGALIVFDTETTGLGKNDRIVEFAGEKCRFHDGKFRPYEKLHIYIKPDFPMPRKASEINGITDRLLSDKPNEKESFGTIKAFLGENPVLCAYNIGFDVRMLTGLYERNSEKFIPELEVDALKIVRDLFCTTKTPDKKLQTIANAYGVDKDISFHTASDDVTVLIRVLNAMITDMKRADHAGPKEYLRVFDVRYWEGYRGNSRLYVLTEKGSLYYSFKEDFWGTKSEQIRTDAVDMRGIESQTFELTGCDSYKELKRKCDKGVFSEIQREEAAKGDLF